jgi:fermentation-respiration switch protein FrsA (DUF1100 family)
MPMKWPQWVTLISLLVAAFYYFYPRIENYFVFFPERSFDSLPEALRLTCRNVNFTTEDGKKLHGWFFPGQKDDPVILHFHGNAGNISHRLDLIRHFLQRRLQVFIIDYRGFGKSEGSPSEKGLYRDGVAAYEHLVHQEGVLPNNIVLHGHSIGAAVAVEVGLRKPVKAVILESAFTSTRDMAKTIPVFFLVSPFLPANYNNLAKVARLQIPTLIIHGDADEIVPFAMGEKLFAWAGEPKFFLRLEGAGHNDTYLVGGKQYLDVIERFARTSTL